jgi:hypothetical protein
MERRSIIGGVLGLLGISARPSVAATAAATKKFKLTADQIKPLVTGRGACLATDKITVEGRRVGYMYRERPDNKLDSGWRFFAGD